MITGSEYCYTFHFRHQKTTSFPQAAIKLNNHILLSRMCAPTNQLLRLKEKNSKQEDLKRFSGEKDLMATGASDEEPWLR